MFQRWCCALVGLMVVALPCAAQLMIGDKLAMKMNGIASSGYSGSFGNESGSTHSLNIGGTVSGFYYDPNFVSFNLLPYYNQSHDNSNYQSLSDSSGVTATANIAKESRFPGSISYTKSYNTSGTLGLADQPNFTTHGN